jgi:acetolactate synthase small subunit
MLLLQNEDFSKMVSELSRYYYRIKQWSSKLKELVDIMEVYDEKMDQKITRMMWEEIYFDEPKMHVEEGKKFF